MSKRARNPGRYFSVLKLDFEQRLSPAEHVEAAEGLLAERRRRDRRAQLAVEEEVDDVVGPKGKHNAERTAVRHGHEDGEVTLGGSTSKPAVSRTFVERVVKRSAS